MIMVQVLRTAFAIGVLMACLAAAAETPVGDLAVPPPDARHFTIVSSAGKHGESARWTTADGRTMGRESMVLRGQVFELDNTVHFGPDGMPDAVEVRGFTPNGDAGEHFSVTGGQAVWKSPVDAGSAAYTAPAAYSAFGGPLDLTAILIEKLIAAPGKSLAMLPGGELHAEPLTSVTLGGRGGKHRVNAFAVTGFSNTRLPVWVDDGGRFFALVGSLSYIAAGEETAVPALERAQDEALARRSPGILKSLLRTPAGPVAFTHVRAFLDDAGFAEDQTVIVVGGVITRIGPCTDTAVPAAAEIIDGTGKSLVPGLWDSHMHFGDDASGPMLLSLGVTSVRDPGNVNALTLARARRRARAQLLMPHVYPSVLIDGKGPNSAQSGSIATSEQEALAIVRKARADGFVAIKIYGTFNPAWLPATIAEAHRLGLHVHGHLPAGVRPSQAIGAGYDEITHINFVIMEAMPAPVVEQSNGMARFEGPGRYAKDVDLSAEPMKSLIETMARRHIVVDPTLVVYEGMFIPENGDLSAAYAPFVGTMPPAVERGFRQGGFAVPPDLTRADYQRSFAKLQELVGALHRAGVPIVAGTDGSGLEIVRELELYVAAGFTPAQALDSATLAAARLVGASARTGSIAVGKNADLVLVDGDPSRSIGDLRHTRIVMMDGKLMDADSLRRAGGFAGRPALRD